MLFQVFTVNKVFIVNKVNGIESNDELIEKFVKSKTRKLSMSKKTKSEKLFKSQKSVKSRKKQSKNGNLSKFDAIEAKPHFLIFKARVAFNR